MQHFLFTIVISFILFAAASSPAMANGDSGFKITERDISLSKFTASPLSHSSPAIRPDISMNLDDDWSINLRHMQPWNKNKNAPAQPAFYNGEEEKTDIPFGISFKYTFD